MPHVNLEALAREFEAGAESRELRDKYKIGSRALLRNLVKARRSGLVREEALASLVVDRTRHEFPKDSEARMEAVLSCVNSELKQATVLVMDKYPFTGNDTHARLQQYTDAKIPDRKTLYNYCSATFSPIGFLVEELFGRGLGLADRYFTLSDAGLVYGQAIAAFSLRFAVDNNLSLYQFFGPTYSTGNSRAPYNRARIVELVNAGHNTMVDIARQIGLEDCGVREHLKRLNEAGIVIFDSSKSSGISGSVLGPKSDIALYERAPLMLAYVDAVREALADGVSLATMNDMLQEFNRDKDIFRKYLNAGIEIYGAVSPRLNAKSSQDREAEIVEFIRSYQNENGTGPRRSEMVKELDYFAEGNIGPHLRNLVQNGVAIKSKEGATVRYTLK